MLLAVDVGNTNIVLGGFDGDKIAFTSRIQTQKNKMPDEYAIAFNSILHFHGFSKADFEGAIVSSVVPHLTTTLKSAIGDLLSCKVMTVSPGRKTGLNIKIEDPTILGADLVCGAVGAVKKYKMPCIIIDMGTATKFSMLDESGAFLGVAIMPGVNISLAALCEGTAMLPTIDFATVTGIIGKNTVESMRSGVVYGTASMIEGMVKRIKAVIGDNATVVATGGVAGEILPYCEGEIIYDEHLVLRGVKQIYDKNSK